MAEVALMEWPAPEWRGPGVYGFRMAKEGERRGMRFIAENAETFPRFVHAARVAMRNTAAMYPGYAPSSVKWEFRDHG